MHILVVDIGGTNVKVWKTGESDSVKFSSGKKLTPVRLVERVRTVASDWSFDRVSIGFPAEVTNGRPSSEPFNLGRGWVEFDWSNAFHCPLRIMNDACMQALGSYEGGKMLYLGLGTGIGTVFIIDGKIVPLALGHLLLPDGQTFDHVLSRKGLKSVGAGPWRTAVHQASQMLRAAFFADYVVLGGGHAKKVKELPEGCRKGGNHNAYFGGLRMWDDAAHIAPPKLSLYRNDTATDPACESYYSVGPPAANA